MNSLRGGKLVKRRHPRYVLRSEVEDGEITLVGVKQGLKAPIHGQIQNISAGGLCFKTTSPVEISGLVRCEIPLPHLSVAIPTLMEVRWTEPNTAENSYRVGLQFLL